MVATRDAKLTDHEQTHAEQNTGQIRLHKQGGDSSQMNRKE